MNILKRIFSSALSIINALTLILLFLSAFSGTVSPNITIVFPFLGLAFPFILAINIIFCISWLISGHWVRAATNVVAFAVCFSAIKTYFPMNMPTKNIPENSIKVLSYNIMQFEYKKPNKKGDPNDILKYLVNSKADIICLQEFAASRKKAFLTEDDIKGALKDYPYSKIYQFKWVPNRDIFGMAVFSKFPILSFKRIDFQSEFNGAFMVELDINGKRATLINNHLESNKLSMEERYEYNDLLGDFNSKKLDKVTEKMAKRLTPAFQARAKQAEIISTLIKNNENPYMIVCGDFNDTPISYSKNMIEDNLIDSFTESGFGLGTTYNKFRFYFRIDYIFHSKNIKSYNCTVDKLRNSDHYPIWTYLQLN